MHKMSRHPPRDRHPPKDRHPPRDRHHRLNKIDFHHRVDKMDLHPPIKKYMGWLSKVVKSSVNKVIRGQYDGNFSEGYSTQHATSHGTHTSDNEDIDRAIALSLSEEGQRKGKAIDTDDHLEEDEELARALQESLKDKHPLRQKIPAGGVHSDSTPATSLLPDILPSSRSRVCAGCKTPLGHGQFLSCMDSVWHPQCFRCSACSEPISDSEYMKIIHTTVPATRRTFIQNVMFARTLFEQIKMV
uniref:LIM zinc-binding domain-containing protein n=1 Tax=Aegilops tauschii subsp. strangulata TaxID=200361 RepID=A0A453HC58_AEGTS